MTRPTLSVFNYKIANQGSDAIDVHIDGDIVDASTQEIMKNWWGDETSVSFKSFRNQIDSANAKTVNVYVNSTGGHVGDAMAMHDYLVELENKGVTVNRIGRGIIASAATYLMIGKNSSMTANSMMMIHNVSMVAYGDINQCENQVRAGRKYNDLIRDFYANVTGKPKETIASWMNKETWFTAQEAKENGFISNVAGEAKFSNAIKPESWPYQNTAVLNLYNSHIHSNSSDMDLSKKVTDAINNGFNSLLEKLGIKDKAGDDNVKNALSTFTESITNALAEGSTPDQGAIQNMVNTAVTEAMKNIGSNEAIKNLITESTKNSLTKADLENAKTEITNSLAGKLGGKSGEDTEVKNKDQRKLPKNRFSGVTWHDDSEMGHDN